MYDYYGDINKSKIWLIADSPPKRWQDNLSHPLDPKHPAVHNIWTPVFDRVNEVLFNDGLRLKRAGLYIINAVTDSDCWNKGKDVALSTAVQDLKDKIDLYKPSIIITFGSRAYEAVFQTQTGNRQLKDWTSAELGKGFKAAIENFSAEDINILPLLHISVSYGKFLDGQADYCGICRCKYNRNTDYNYFAYVGERIAEKLAHYKAHFQKHFIESGIPNE